MLLNRWVWGWNLVIDALNGAIHGIVAWGDMLVVYSEIAYEVLIAYCEAQPKWIEEKHDSAHCLQLNSSTQHCIYSSRHQFGQQPYHAYSWKEGSVIFDKRIWFRGYVLLPYFRKTFN